MIDLSGKKTEFILAQIDKLLSNNPELYPSKAEIARLLDIKPQYLNSIMRGRRNVSDKFFKKFIKTFSVNQNDILEVEKECNEWMYENVDKIRIEERTRIPFVSVSAIGGFGNSSFAIEKRDIKDHYVVPKFKDRNIDFMIEVYGTSMYPRYNSGDVVACTIIRESSFIQWNKVHIIATKEQGILIKRLKQGKDKDMLLAVSDNVDYDPFEIPRNEITGIAIVVGVIRLE